MMLTSCLTLVTGIKLLALKKEGIVLSAVLVWVAKKAIGKFGQTEGIQISDSVDDKVKRRESGVIDGTESASVVIEVANSKGQSDFETVAIPQEANTITSVEVYKGRTCGECPIYGKVHRDDLEKEIARLEGAKYAVVFPTGMCAFSSILSVFPHNTKIVSSNEIYSGSYRYLESIGSHLNLSLTFADISTEEKAKAAITEDTEVVFFETPCNPTMRVIDIKKLVDVSKSINPNIIHVIDNTFMTPLLQKPIALDVDVVIHSSTKYINGHSDVMMGAIVTNSDDIFSKVTCYQRDVGLYSSHFDCYLVNSGIKTLSLRIKRSEENAMAIARLLSSSEYVTSVNYPGLPSNEYHVIAKKQQKSFGGILSFTLSGSSDKPLNFIKNLKLFSNCVSLGGVESLIETPANMSHASMPVERRLALGISDQMIRISAGVEDTKDILDDISNALHEAYKQP